MSAFIEMQRKVAEEEKKYFLDPVRYVQSLKEIAEERLGSPVRVIIFGSAVRGEWVPGRSDIDVLIISDRVPESIHDRSEIVSEFLRSIGDLCAPFEVHFANQQLFENWYSRFIGRDFIEV